MPITPEDFAVKLKRDHGADLFLAHKRREILDKELALAGIDPKDEFFRSRVTLALLPKKLRGVA